MRRRRFVRRSIGMRKARKGLSERKRPPAEPAAYPDVKSLLRDAWQVFNARVRAARARGELDDDLRRGELTDPDARRARKAAVADDRRATRAWDRHFHRSLDLTGDDNPLAGLFRSLKLNHLEREVVLVLLLDRLSMTAGEPDADLDSIARVLACLCVPPGRMINALRNLAEGGRLIRSRVVAYDDDLHDLRDRRLLLDPVLVDQVLAVEPGGRRGFEARSEDDLLDRLAALTAALRARGEEVKVLQRGFGDRADFYKQDRRLHHLVRRLTSSLQQRPGWALARFFAEPPVQLTWHQRLVVLALVGKERGHLEADHELFTGAGLARATCREPDEVEPMVRQLGPGRPLADSGLVQPCGGFDTLISDHPSELAAAEFELGDRCLELLGLSRQHNHRRTDGPQVRAARVRLDQLVLADDVHQALSMARAQADNAAVLIDDWGLGGVVPYGRAVTLMFTGPPGVGKTACAEGLAHALGRPILVADFSRIQNCFVGMTEKNIARTFRAARAQGAVLFWDEADAMFFGRDQAHQTFEVRHVNVLLQELERFEGVCVLATNRPASLDPALDRRLAMKIAFPRPDRPMRRAIWEKLIPPEMPLAAGVDLDALAAHALTGGQIKNAVLNAARLALSRGPRTEVSRGDLDRAVEMELAPKGRAEVASIGFAPRGQCAG